MIKSIYNDHKNSLKDQNQKNGEIGEIFYLHDRKKKQVKSFR
jgi:hypothetical protein